MTPVITAKKYLLTAPRWQCIFIFLFIYPAVSISLFLDKFSKAFVACSNWREVIFQITLVFPLGSFNMTFVLTRS